MAANFNESKRYCFIQDDDGSVGILCSCLAKQLESVTCKNSVDYLLNSCVQSHHKIYRTGTRTLLRMTKLFLGQMKSLEKQGISKTKIMASILQCLELCCTNLQEVTYIIDFNKQCNLQRSQKCSNEIQCPNEIIDSEDCFKEIEILCSDSLNEIPIDRNKQQPLLQADFTCNSFLLEGKQNINMKIDNDDNDIDWFFENQNKAIPDNCDINGDMLPQLTIGATSVLQRQIEKLFSDVDLHSDIPRIQAVTQERDAENVDSPSTFSSTQETKEFDDEFDDCFDDDYQSNKPLINKDSVSDSNMPSVSSDKENCSNGNTHELNIGNNGGVFNSHAQPITEMLNNQKHACSSIFQNETLSFNSLKPTPVTVSSIEKKLNDLLNKKKNSTSKILNRSRHFSSIDSTLKEQNSDEQTVETTIFASGDQKCLTEKACHSKIQVEKSKSVSSAKTIDDVNVLIAGLCHGMDSDVLQTFHEIFKSQNSDKIPNDVSFHLDRVQTLVSTGPLNHGLVTLYDGLLVKTTVEQLCLIQEYVNSNLNCLLINGDLSTGFRHLGFKMEQSVKYVHSNVQSMTKENLWLQEVIDKCKQLNLQLLLVKGKVDDRLVNHCLSEKIIVISGVSYKVLEAVGETAQVMMAQYILECSSKTHVAAGLRIEPHRSDWMDTTNTELHLALLQCSKTLVQTVIFIHPILSVAVNEEENFWHIAYRLSNALKSGRVLHGAGHSEYHCCQVLKQLADKAEKDFEELKETLEERAYEPVIYRAISNAFLHFYLQVNLNEGNNLDTINTSSTGDAHNTEHDIHVINSFDSKYLDCNNSSSSYKESYCDKCTNQNSNCDRREPMFSNENGNQDKSAIILDDFLSKTEAWKSAGQLACQIFNTEMEILTGQSGTKFCVL